jgi:hypothetical protein
VAKVEGKLAGNSMEKLIHCQIKIEIMTTKKARAYVPRAFFVFDCVIPILPQWAV